MRAFVVAGLVVFHSAVVFAADSPWFVKNSQQSIGFTAFLLWGSLWGMPLLFLVSGMGARYALRSRSLAGFARERLARLLVPFAVGLVLLVPPMFYIARAGQPGWRQSYPQLWLSYLNIPAIARGLLPNGSWTSRGAGFDPAHLWFLYVLLVYSLALLPLFGYLRSPRGMRLAGMVAGFTERHTAVALLAAALPLMAVEAIFGPDTNTGGWERLAYLFPFLYGFLITTDKRFETALKQARWPALACAIMATGALAGWAATLGGPASGFPAGWDALQGLAGAAWLAAILGFAAAVTARLRPAEPVTAAAERARRRQAWQSAARYANEAVLPFYLLHEPVIVAVAWLIVRWQGPVPAEYAAVVVVSFAATLALYEILVRRLRATRILFGMRAARP